ncbi:EAL domain-containing protein [Vibrio sonorensis]|uniref:EAL domain-containing protein n=1 Tax=Vibrio sonorensis TaxID=1004316 RepID=UPI0008D92949|nr:EAL domain-containing protein [Vibrio sonorensis]
MATSKAWADQPAVFIPIAEREQLINTLTDYVLSRVLKDLALQARDEPIHVAVNIPPSYLHEAENRDNLLHYRNQLKNFGYLLSVELTERQIIDNTARSTLEQLRLEELLIAIDDFGTGHTSLSVIQDTQFDYLKIDKCFIDSIGLDTVNAPVLNTIVDLGHRLGVHIVAEGVETEQQADYLTEIGVSHLQGFYFAKPMKAQALRHFEIINTEQNPIPILAT